MAVSVSPPVRIIAIVGLIAAIALGGGFMLLGRKSDSATPPPVVIKHHPFGPGAAAKTHAKVAPHTGTAAPATKHAPAVHVRQKPAAETAALAAGLPAPVAEALGKSPVVVVELVDPQSEVDGIAFAEAQAGAALAGVPFVALNVLSQADVGKLTEQLGQILPAPGLLVYTRPAELAVRIDGFVDKETVAQAAANAAP